MNPPFGMEDQVLASGPRQIGGPRGPSFTQVQLQALHNIPRVTGALSLLGSFFIIYMILKSSQHKLKRTQNRLIFAISVVDIPFSFMFVLGTVLMPRGLPFPGTFGNTQTCTFQGFMIQLGYAQPIYNAFLMIFYVLTVCGGVRNEFISKWIEPTFHGFAVLFALGTAIAGIPLDIYNPTPVGRCQIFSFPLGCVKNPQVDCQRGENHEVFKWAFNLVPTLAALVVQFAALFILCLFVLRRERENKKKARQRAGRSKGLQYSLTASNVYGRRVAIRALLYAAIFFNTYVWITIPNMRRLIAHYAPPYWIVLLGNMLQPSQGFFNFFLFLHPRYSTVRQSYQDWPWWRVTWFAIHEGTGTLSNSSSSFRDISGHHPRERFRLDSTATTSLPKVNDSADMQVSSEFFTRTETPASDPIDEEEEEERDEMGILMDKTEKRRRSTLRISTSAPPQGGAISIGGVLDDHDNSKDELELIRETSRRLTMGSRRSYGLPEKMAVPI